MVYAIIDTELANVFIPNYLIVKIIKKHNNGRYTISYPQITKFNEYLDEYDFSNTKLQNIICKKEDIYDFPEDYNDMIKFKLPTLIKYYGIKTIYDNDNNNWKLCIKQYIDFEKESELFSYNMILLTKNEFKLHDKIQMALDCHYNINPNDYYDKSYKKLIYDLNYLSNEICKYMTTNMSNYFWNNSCGCIFSYLPTNRI